MQHLTPVGLSKDGANLVLLSNAGEEFAVAVDHRLRAALRGDNARLGQLEMKMESALRPRDIQARIRGGESAEEVAAAAQTTVDAIMGFAAPVLAERAHVAQSAQRSSIRRRSTEASTAAGTLDQAARTHLSDIGVRADDVDWDAWRRDDGRWTLVARFSHDGAPCQAQFTYDAPGRYVLAENDHARRITGELGSAEPATRPTARRLSAVPDDDELPLGDDAIELVREPAAPAPALDDPAADHADADWIAHGPTGPEPADGPAQEPADRPRKRGRSSVPSWDEIMFGGGKSD